MDAEPKQNIEHAEEQTENIDDIEKESAKKLESPTENSPQTHIIDHGFATKEGLIETKKPETVNDVRSKLGFWAINLPRK